MRCDRRRGGRYVDDQFVPRLVESAVVRGYFGDPVMYVNFGIDGITLGQEGIRLRGGADKGLGEDVHRPVTAPDKAPSPVGVHGSAGGSHCARR